MYIKTAFIAAAYLLISGCAMMSPAQRDEAQRQLEANRPVCMGKLQCEAMWDAARDWVSSNCAMKIQTITDSYIATYNPEPYSPEIACSVTRNPRPDGSYELHMRVWCNNFLGCQPTPFAAMAAFERSVNETSARFSSQGK